MLELPLTRIPNVLKAHLALDIKPKRVYNILDGSGYSVSNKKGGVYIHYPGLKDKNGHKLAVGSAVAVCVQPEELTELKAEGDIVNYAILLRAYNDDDNGPSAELRWIYYGIDHPGVPPPAGILNSSG